MPVQTFLLSGRYDGTPPESKRDRVQALAALGRISKGVAVYSLQRIPAQDADRGKGGSSWSGRSVTTCTGRVEYHLSV